MAVLAAAILVPAASGAAQPRLTKERATALFLGNDKVADWLDRYPHDGRVTDATYEPDSSKCSAGGTGGCWNVTVTWKKNDKVDAGVIATGKVDDSTTRVTEAWTGPQVAWKMARGYEGAFGGKKINSLRYWLPFCFVFLLGLLDFRRPLSLRNLDLVALLSFSVSLWYFNHGNVFTSVPLVYPPLLYLLARCVWIGARGRPVRAARPLWKRAQRISSGVMPYDNFPKEDALKACGPADSAGEIRDRIQFNGRCESANPLGDTYGPVAYEAYLPGYWIRGWSGKWDKLPAVHLTSIIFDVLCALGLGLAGLRYGGRWLGAALVFAWAAFPFTQYASMSNTNDTIVPAFLIFGFWLAGSPWARGISVALSGLTKFAPLIVAPLWLTYPGPVRRPRPALAFAAGFVVATVVAFSILLFDGHPVQAAQTFYERTLKTQIMRESPFSLWDWAQYHARGIPDLHIVQRVLEGLLVLGALVAAFVPRTKTPLQLAALTGALLIGFELVLTHWSWLYIPWFFPFVVFALLFGAREQPQASV
ncbi:MAG: hypothetical protein E6G09_13615 [Actinobacteria bacterium]|nr:MAG: hypothetical protein E6G09_13615 [Actinomycetota bacterium]